MAAIITLDTVIRQNEDIIQAEIDSEIVMMSVESGAYYGLDAIAGRIWKLIENPQTVKSLCGQLITEFHVNEEQCQSDVVEFLKDMHEKNVINVAA